MESFCFRKVLWVALIFVINVTSVVSLDCELLCNDVIIVTIEGDGYSSSTGLPSGVVL